MSLEHLGSIAARLRRDAAGCLEQQEHDQLVTILSLIMQSKLERKSPSPINLLSGMVRCRVRVLIVNQLLVDVKGYY